MKILTQHCFKSVDESAFLGMMRAVKGEKSQKKEEGKRRHSKRHPHKQQKKTMLALGLSSPFFLKCMACTAAGYGVTSNWLEFGQVRLKFHI